MIRRKRGKIDVCLGERDEIGIRRDGTLIERRKR